MKTYLRRRWTNYIAYSVILVWGYFQGPSRFVNSVEMCLAWELTDGLGVRWILRGGKSYDRYERDLAELKEKRAAERAAAEELKRSAPDPSKT